MKKLVAFITALIVCLGVSSQTYNTPFKKNDTVRVTKNGSTIATIPAQEKDSALRAVITTYQFVEPPPSEEIKIVSISKLNGTGKLTHPISAPANSLIVVTTGFEGNNKNCTIGGSAELTWTKTSDVQAQNSGDAEIYSSKVTAAGNYTVTTQWDGWSTSVVYVITGAEGIGAKAMQTNQDAPAVTLTTTKAGSIIIGTISDFNGRDGSARVYRDNATDVYYSRASTKSGTGYHFYKTAQQIKSYTEGLTSPNTMSAGTALIEVKAKEGSTLPDTLPPSSPVLTVSNTSSNSVSLTWSSSVDDVGVSGYNVYSDGRLVTTTKQISYVVENLSPATSYEFYVEAKDDAGNKSKSNTVSATTTALPNQAPTANAGQDITLLLPANSTTLSGSGTDADGTIILYQWQYVSGPAQWTLGDANAATTTLSNLVNGTYIFRLQVTDNKGALGTDNITISVKNNAPDIGKIKGYGADAVGGSNSSSVYHVTNLKSSGAGSLLNGIGSNKTIVFDVAGTIPARHDFTNVSYVTVDGTTAPYPGITITASNGNGMSFENSHHFIVKGLTFVNCTNDGLNAVDCNNFAFINCTAYGNQDGNIDFAGCDKGTMQDCIIGNHNGAPFGGTGGSLITSINITIWHCLFNPVSPNPDEGERFPLVHCNYSPIGTPNADIRNNLIWNWGRSNSTGSGYGIGIQYAAQGNAVNNYLKTKSSDAKNDGIALSSYGSPTGHAYIAGNVSGNGVDYNKKSDRTEYEIPAKYQVPVESACDGARYVLQYAGITQRDTDGNRTPAEAKYISGIVEGATGCIGKVRSKKWITRLFHKNRR